MIMQFPCEILVKKILPAIRAIMVKEIYDKFGKNQKEIATILGITQPSVSYYLSGERGEDAIDIIKDSEAYNIILKLTEKLAKSEVSCEDLIKEICSICLKVRPIYIQKMSPKTNTEYLNERNVCFIE